MKNNNNKIVAVDLGTSAIRLVVGEIMSDGRLEVRLMLEHPMSGLREGMITNYEEAVRCVRAVIGEMNAALPNAPRSVSIGLGGSLIDSIEAIGYAKNVKKGGVIGPQDIKIANDNARANLSLPQGWTVIHSQPQEYKVGETTKIINPINMPAAPLEVKTLFIVAQEDRIANFSKLFADVGIKVDYVHALPFSAASILVTNDEKESGVVIVDIGEDSSSIISYLAGNITYVGGINLGGGSVTNDLAYILQKNKGICRTFKEEYGCAFPQMVNKDDMITFVHGDENVRFPLSEFTAIIYPRMNEIFSLLKRSLDKVPRYGSYSSGIILSGGGALLSGTAELAKSVFYLNARLGFPEVLQGLPREYINPKYVNVLGLLKQTALQTPGYKENLQSEPVESTKTKKSGGFKALWKNLF